MKNKLSHLVIFSIAFAAIWLTSCNQSNADEPADTNMLTTTVEPTSTPDPSIIWGDDFEDGDLTGWIIPDEWGGEFFVEDGNLKVGPCLECDDPKIQVISHASAVATGTWSFDLFHPEMLNTFIGFTSNPRYGQADDRSEFYNHGLNFDAGMQRVYVYFFYEGRNSQPYQYAMRDLSGWQHFDITRTEDGHTMVYLNGAPIFDYSDDRINASEDFYIVGVEGMQYDNIVVRNQVIDFSAPAK